MCHHDKDGSIGLILNKPAVNPFANEPNHQLGGFPFYAGGPVDVNHMFFVHQISYLPEALLLKDGIYWQGDYENLLEAVEENTFTANSGRLLVGYSGWAEGQLEDELNSEDWMVYNGPIQDILSIDPESIWKVLLQKMGPYFKMVSNFPQDPNLN